MGNRRTIVIGDVHGCLIELDLLLKACLFQKETDRLIFVGDLIGKGPNSKGVLERLEELEAESVIGNHELSYLQHQQKSSGRLDWVELDRCLGESRTRWIDKIKAWPSFIETKEFIVVHGGLIPGRAPVEKDRNILASLRTWDGKGQNLNNSNDPPWYELYVGPKLVVYGHWAVQGLHIRSLTIGLDSGCVYGGHLTAVILPERKIVQVNSKQKQDFKR